MPGRPRAPDVPATPQRLPEPTKLPQPRKENKIERGIYGDYYDTGYVHVSKLRGWDQVYNRAYGFKLEKEPELPGLHELATAKSLYIKKGQEIIGASVSYYFANENNTRIYVAHMVRGGFTVKGQLMTNAGVPVLIFFSRSIGFACFTRTKVSVTHQRDQNLGTIVFRSDSAELWDADKHKILEIIVKFHEADIEYIVVEIDSTKVGIISETEIHFSRYFTTTEKALLVGAWLPIALNIVFGSVKRQRPKEEFLRDKDKDKEKEKEKKAAAPAAAAEDSKQEADDDDDDTLMP